MSHALIAIASSAITGFLLTPPIGDGGYQAGMLITGVAALIAALVAYSMEDKP